ncbi:MAG TPA: DivIVA domain-containing protein [Acidimicrobiales bacterium]|nr:DivIVA domain-containing protein [Acidimicrobiales bacterium]
MDLSPKLLTDVQFREQWRGYNPDEVDEFLERVAAGVEELQQRLHEAMERASNAERRLIEHTDEDEIRRTLVLAQRTAVASMEEARAEADRLVSETEARCRHLVAEAEAQAARLDADIATRRRLELGNLAEQRAALQLDIDHLQGFLEVERARLAELLRAQLESVETGLQLRATPTVSDVAPPPPPEGPVELRAADTIDAEPLAEEPFVEPEEDSFASIFEPEPEPVSDTSAVDELRLAREELADALRRAGVEPAGDDGGDDDRVPPRREPRPLLFDDDGGDATGAYDVLADEAPAPAPVPEADEPRWRDEAEAEDDDPFLAELRRAVVDTEPLGPREHEHGAAPSSYEDGDDDDDPGGFFRRGRRRG